MYVLAVLADRQGLLKGDLNRLQRALLIYLIGRERELESKKDFRKFKEAMIAAHPELTPQINEDFEAAEKGEAIEEKPTISAEEFQQMRENAEFEEAQAMLGVLGAAMQDI